MDERLKVVFFVTNYPSNFNKVSGIFFKRIAEGLAKEKSVDITVIAPRPYLPKWIYFLLYGKKMFGKAPKFEIQNNVKVFRPYYLRLPLAHKFMFSHFFLYPVVERIISSIKPDLIDFRTSYPTYPYSKVVRKLSDKFSILSSLLIGFDFEWFIKSFEDRSRFF